MGSQTSNFDEATWEGCTSPYLEATQSNAVSQKICAELLEKCSHVVMSKRKADEVEEEEGEDLCDCEFSLAYGGMILLNNTRMKLKVSLTRVNFVLYSLNTTFKPKKLTSTLLTSS